MRNLLRPAATLAALAVLLAAALPAPAQPGAVSLEVTGSTGAPGVTVEAVAARLASYVNGWYAGILEVVPAGAPAAVRVTLEPAAGGLSARTELTRGTTRSSRVTTLPPGSFAGLLPVLACDMAWLWGAPGGFADLPLAPAPTPAASLSVDTLAALTGWNAEELEPLAVAGDDGRVTVTFPHGWLTLGPGFSLTSDTARDILALGFGREPLQLSSAVRVRGSSFALLSERESAIAWVDTRLGTRTVRAAPGLPAGRAERLGDGSVAVLSPGGVLTWQDADAAPRRIGGGGLASAFTTDAEGNAWVFDAAQGRVQVLTPQGREVHSVRPLARSPGLQFPQQIAVFADGSFLLGGAGELWKFSSTGIPAWRMDRIPGPVAESLPSSFQLAVDRRAGSFVLLDGPSRRLLAFGPGAPAGGAAPGDGLLAALQEAARAGRGDEAGDAAPAARRALLRQKARLLVELAAGLQAEFLPEQAEKALLRAAEAAREALAEDPADSDTARLLAQAVAARREARDALSREPGLAVAGASAEDRPGRPGGPGPSGRVLAVTLRLRNTRSFPLSRLRVSAAAPGLSLMPSLAEAGPLGPGQETRLALAIPIADPFVRVGPTVQAAALLAWERDSEGGTTAARFPVEVVAPGPAGEAAGLLAGLLLSVDPDDPLVRATVAELSAGAEERFSAAAAVLDALGRARQASPGGAGDGRTGPLAARRALRALSADPVDWALLTAEALSALGFPTGFLAWPGAAVTLVDTGIPLADALARVPGLSRDRDTLAALSRDGRMCVPLSGAPLPSPSAVTAPVFALLQGLRTCRERGTASGASAWLDGSGPAGPRAAVPAPFPARFPVVTRRFDRDTLAAEIQSELEKLR